MLRLKWLKVNQFRSVAAGTRLEFNDGHNVLLGQNGTGKTTLLNLVAAAAALDLSDLLREPFDLAFELRNGDASVLLQVGNRPQPQPEIIAGLAMPEKSSLGSAYAGWLGQGYEATIVLHGFNEVPEAELVLHGTKVSARRLDLPSVEPVDSEIASGNLLLAILVGAEALLEDAEAKRRASRTLLNCLWTTLGARRFDESLEYLQRLLHTPRRIGTDVPPLPDDPIPIGQAVSRGWSESSYKLAQNEVPFLSRVVQVLGFADAELRMDLRAKAPKYIELSGPSFTFTRRNGERISADYLSYGQKRMLAFFHYLAISRSIIVADELVNGLHHGWIRTCLEEIGERQTFLTSQNPLLLDYLTFDSAEAARRTFVLCRCDADAGTMVWENMSSERARDFFDAYKVGFQQVGELLQAGGLW